MHSKKREKHFESTYNMFKEAHSWQKRGAKINHALANHNCDIVSHNFVFLVLKFSLKMFCHN